MARLMKKNPSEDELMWAARANKAREILTSRGHNYAIIVMKRMGISSTDTVMVNKIFNVAKGKVVDRQITIEMEELERLSRVMLPMDVLCQMKEDQDAA